MTLEELKRREIEFLLPWHAAGTLSRREADLVERALAEDRELARRYEHVRRELAETIDLNETLGEPSARAMEKLLPRSTPRRYVRRAADLGASAARLRRRPLA